MVGFRGLVALATFVCSSVATNQYSLPKCLDEDKGCPWGDAQVADLHPWKDAPQTGITRCYELIIERATLAPDGVPQAGFTINGQFPGPLIEANWGDEVEVVVVNNIAGPGEGTTIHWHGINQHGTPYHDGVPTVNQCPIAPGTNYTYTFRADSYGTTWYHSHFSAQYGGGVFGPFVIYGPSHVEYDADLGPISSMDWYHTAYDDLADQVVATGVTGQAGFRPKGLATLVQGVGRFPCANVTNGLPCSPPAYKSWDFEEGQTYKMRFINTGAVAFLTISIDEHSFTVIAEDVTPVVPYTTNLIVLAIGQRIDVLVKATGTAGKNYWLRSWNDPLCGDNLGPDGRGIINYPGASGEPVTTGYTLPVNRACANAPLNTTTPVYVMPVVEPDITLTFTLTVGFNASRSFLWFMNGIAYKGDFNNPLLLDTSSGVTEFPTERLVFDTGDAKTVRVIFYNTFIAPHPMHVHGHEFQVLAEGRGTWDGSIVNPQNPLRRDVQAGWAGANASNPAVGPNYAVFQWEQDNPGVWPFHCHLAWHLSAGMAVMINERPDDQASLDFPSSVAENCANWDTWTQNNIVDVTDSGLRKRVAPLDQSDTAAALVRRWNLNQRLRRRFKNWVA